MRIRKIYEPSDRMSDVIENDYKIIQTLSRFGIMLGFGEKTVEEVCKIYDVDPYTFLTVVNFAVGGSPSEADISHLSVRTLMKYLKASHDYHISFQIPEIREKLHEATDENEKFSKLILSLFDDYTRSVIHHMQYEEKTIFPYVENLLKLQADGAEDGASAPGDSLKSIGQKGVMETYSKHHDRVISKLAELKQIILRYIPSDTFRGHQLGAVLYDICESEDWLNKHSEVEDKMLVPAIRLLEYGVDNRGREGLSDREKEVVVSLVQGMSNKQIADHLNISLNTVLTHRKNIARKLHIHSPAGLTIYAIINNLVDIASVRIG